MHSMAPLGLMWVAPLALVGVHSFQAANQQRHLRATLLQPGAQVSSLLGHCLSCCPLVVACVVFPCAVACIVVPWLLLVLSLALFSLGAISWIMHAVTS